MKDILKIALLLLVFYFINVATSIRKWDVFPCEYKIMYYLGKDTINQGHLFTYTNDTIVLKAYKDTLWDIKTAALCQILRDSCNISNFKFLVVDTIQTPDPARKTRFGNRIYFRNCN